MLKAIKQVTVPSFLVFLVFLGGRISGEHGIGHKRKKYLPLVVDDVYMQTMRAIKKALDPNCVCNPGKIFD